MGWDRKSDTVSPNREEGEQSREARQGVIGDSSTGWPRFD